MWTVCQLLVSLIGWQHRLFLRSTRGSLSPRGMWRSSCRWPLLFPAQPLPRAFPAPGGAVGSRPHSVAAPCACLSSSSSPSQLACSMLLKFVQDYLFFGLLCFNLSAVSQLLQRVFWKIILLVAYLKYLKEGLRIFSLSPKCMLKSSGDSSVHNTVAVQAWEKDFGSFYGPV